MKLILSYKRYLIPLFILIALSVFLSTLDANTFKVYVETLGIFGPILIILYTVISHILAPLVGTPSVAVSFLLYGPQITVILMYISSLISSVINYYIARKYGVVIVTKLAGKHTMNEIHEISQIIGIKILIFARLFGFPIFELISYAAGLTEISFKSYFTITAFVSLIPFAITFFLVKDLVTFNPLFIFAWLTFLFIVGTLFILWLRSHIRSFKKRS